MLLTTDICYHHTNIDHILWFNTNVRIDMSTFLNLAHDKLSYSIISIRELLKESITRSQAVARIADRTASQQTLVISDCC